MRAGLRTPCRASAGPALGRAGWALLVAVSTVVAGLVVVGVAHLPVPAGPTPGPVAGPLRAASEVALAPGDDFPTYLGGIERTSAVAGEQLIEPSTVSTLHSIWSYNAFQSVQSQPIESNGSVYFGTKSGYEYAVYATNGSFEWRTFLGQSRNDTVCGNVLGVTSTATVSGGTLYVDGGYPYFYALNLSTGAIEWKAPIGTGGSAQGFYQWSSPLIYDGRAYVGIASDCDQPLVQAGLEMYSLSSQSLIAYFDTSVPKPNGSSIWGSPAINPATNTVFVATGNQYRLVETDYSDSVLAFNASTLALVANWQIPVSEQRGDGDFGVTPTVFTPPGGYPLVVAANKNGVLYALYQSNLTVAWEQPICCEFGTQDEHISAAYANGYVYAVSAETTIDGAVVNSSVLEIDPLSGAIEWQEGFPGTAYYGYAAPVYVNHMLLVADESSLMFLNASTGAVLWETNVPGVVQAAPSIARGEVFASCSNGEVYAFATALNATDLDYTVGGGAPLTAQFNVSVAQGLPPYTYAWSFGDGGMSTLAAPTHTYAAGGDYRVTVAVTDQAGQSSTTNATAAVGPESNVTFVESGLPPSTPWTVMFDRHAGGSNSDAITFSAANGTHAYAVEGPPQFTPLSVPGFVTVLGVDQVVNVSFQPGVPVTFEENGLPPTTDWTVHLAGSQTVVEGNATTFYVPNGTYAYSVDPVSGYRTPFGNGTVTVAGTNVNVSLAFIPINYTVDFTEVGLPVGTNWTVDLNGTSLGTTSDLARFSEPNGLYGFTVHSVAGYTAEPMNGHVHVHGANTSEAVGFTPVYPVTFTESGLPSGTLWNVTLDTTTASSTASSITFDEPNGTYSFVIDLISGWKTGDTGTVHVAGAPRTVPHTFTRGGYLITFQETGLAPGTNWSVLVGGQDLSSTTNLVRTLLLNGTYPYTVPNVPGYTNTRTGSLTVDGQGFTVVEPFTSVRYTVTFKETGLPAVKDWSVTIGNQTVASATNTIVFHLTNGSYTFSVGGMTGYVAAPPAGAVMVAGSAETSPVKFTAVRYQVTFAEAGLPAHGTWQVKVGTVTHSATGPRLTFLEPVGTYSYAPSTSVANYSATGGPFTVYGSNLTVTVTFAPVGGPQHVAPGRSADLAAVPTAVASVVRARPVDVPPG